MASLFKYIIELDHTISTNTYALELLKFQNAKEGTVICANFQSKGQGIRGVNWESEHGKNILMSIVLSPDISIEKQFEINNCMSLALYDFAKKYFTQEVKIKWPNDLLVNENKLGGILINNMVRDGKIRNTIVGIGVNVNQIQFDNYSPPATSLKELLENDFDIEQIQKEILDCIEFRYANLKKEKSSKMREEYLSILYAFNQWRNYKIQDKQIKAKIVGIDEIGKLILEFEDNKTKAFALKEIAYLF